MTAIGLSRVYETPKDADLSVSNWQRQCELYWSYYTGEMFDKLAMDSAMVEKYRQNYDLYKFTRLLINPARQIVDFYVSTIYPGVLSYSGEPLTNGQINAIPLEQSTETKLKSAIGQIWLWSNFQMLKSLIVRYCAAIGSVLVEIIDDIPHGKVIFQPVFPYFVQNVQLDTAGNVKSYTIVWKTKDDNGTYTYKKIVDGQFISYFRDDKPFDYLGFGAIYKHNYTFCPAVWIKHNDYGNVFGLPAISGSIGKIDEICSLVTHAVDLLHKLIESPMIFWTDGVIKDALGTNTPQTVNSDDDFGGVTNKEKASHMILKGPLEGKVETLKPEVELQHVFSMLTVLIDEIKNDHPEVTFFKDLRAMSQLTGVAIEKLVGDVATRLSEHAANYDRQLIKLIQMAITIAGIHANDGTWRSFSETGELTAEQQKFLPFNVDSYKKGELSFNIEPRPLVRSTVGEKAEERVAYWNGVLAAKSGGQPLEMILKDDGWSQERIDEILKNVEANKLVASTIAGGQPSPDNNNQDTQNINPAGNGQVPVNQQQV